MIMRRLPTNTALHSLIAAAVLLSSAGCVDRNNAVEKELRPPGKIVPIASANVDEVQEPAIHLNADVRTLSEDLGVPGALLLVDSAVVVVDGSPRDRPILAFHNKTLRGLGSFSRIGRGPGELRDPWYLAPDPRDSGGFWVLDISLQKLMQLHVGSPNQGASIVTKEISVSKVGGATAFVWLNDSTILLTGTLRNGRVATFVTGSGRLTFGGILRGDPNVQPMFRNLAYEIRPVRLNNTSKVALLGMHTGDIELVDHQGTHHGFAETVHRFDPVYRAWKEGGYRGYVPSDSLRFGYVWGTASVRLLFGLFSGRMRLKSTSGSSYAGRWVHVFDTSGYQCARLRLDDDAIAIAVDASHSFLFASTHGENPGIARYPLPPGLCSSPRR
jgi:hypothetical protein